MDVEPWHDCVTQLMRDSRRTPPSALPDAVDNAVRPLGLDIQVYLVDREQRGLHPLPRRERDAPATVPINSTIAGRAYTHLEVTVPPGEPRRMWVPLVDDSERLGVMDLRLPDGMDSDDPAVRHGSDLIAIEVAHLLVAKQAYGDTIRRTRRSRTMSTEGEMLWRSLPPLTSISDHLAVTAVLEPCYDVGGDAFDYAIDYETLRVGVFDAVGHGLTAALTSTLTLAAVRAARAADLGLPATAAAADQAITSQFEDMRYVTAVLAELYTGTGVLRYINAGHPPAVLMRAGKAVTTLDAAPRTPLGIAGPSLSPVAEEQLEPGDRLLFHTDGITEARDAQGRFFGVDRLVDLAERHAASGLPAAETLRRLSHTVVDYQAGRLTDDATLVIVEWFGGGS